MLWRWCPHENFLLHNVLFSLSSFSLQLAPNLNLNFLSIFTPSLYFLMELLIPWYHWFCLHHFTGLPIKQPTLLTNLSPSQTIDYIHYRGKDSKLFALHLSFLTLKAARIKTLSLVSQASLRLRRRAWYKSIFCSQWCLSSGDSPFLLHYSMCTRCVFAIMLCSVSSFL